MKLSPAVVKFIYPGVVPSLKNSNGMNRHGQRFDNNAIKAFKAQFGLFVPAKYRDLKMGGKDDLLCLTVALFHDNWRRDVDVEIIKDGLQAAGVVSNDRWIRREFIYGERIDPDNPRAEITLSYL